ncbi:pol protein [Lasius niger]|uniref:Pol protein n=1 Tax=Lasius niger TaxID=67767 RepID=A0A0J7JSR2_LASNI|nr:pol protein [Lasius niger]
MVEIVMLATTQYNKSVINRRPADIVLTHPDEPQVEIHNRIQKAQTALRAKENASRQNRTFDVGEKVLVKSNRRLGNKLTPLCEEKAVEADMGTTVLIEGRVVNKDHLKCRAHQRSPCRA